MATRGIPEVPIFKPRTIVDGQGKSHKVMEYSEELRRFLVDTRQQLVDLRATQAPLSTPTNLNVTPQAFSNLVQWTRVPGADYFEVLWSPNGNINNATIVDVGNSQTWLDHAGNVGIQRFYWVRARKLTGARSKDLGPAVGVTLGSAAGVTPPPPPPASNIIVIDTRTGHQVPYVLDTGHGDRSLA